MASFLDGGTKALFTKFSTSDIFGYAEVLLTSFELTHLPLVPHEYVSELRQHWFR